MKCHPQNYITLKEKERNQTIYRYSILQTFYRLDLFLYLPSPESNLSNRKQSVASVVTVNAHFCYC